MTVTDNVLATCTLRPGPWPPAERCCAWCGDPLPKRSRRWCAGDCEPEFRRQHAWTAARPAAIERDGRRCVRCGTCGDNAEAEAVAGMALWWALTPDVLPLGRWADAEGLPAYERSTYEAWVLYRGHHPRRLVAKALEIIRRGCALEVNHKVPILGRHGQFGCHHHLDGLETLCHACHVAETARQFGRTKPDIEQLAMGDVA